MPSTRTLIVGGGFAGVGTARALRRRLPPAHTIALYSPENYFVFTPFLSEVVGAAINPIHAVRPIREMVRGVECRTVPVVGLDLGAREILFESRDGGLHRDGYDHLVLCPGLEPNLDLLPGMAAHAWPVKNLADALVLRNRILSQLEKAEVESRAEHRARHLSFAIVGGGLTGVEIAGSMADLLAEARRYYRQVAPQDLRVTLVEAAPRLLAPLPESLAAFAQRKMSQRGIDVRVATAVAEVTHEGLRLAGGEILPAATVVAAVGNRTHPLLAASGLPLTGGRLRVTPEMRVEGHPEVWALGDCAAVVNAYDGAVSATTAQHATRQARQLAHNLAAVIQGGRPQPFRYRPLGAFAAIGHRNAVGSAFGVQISGFPAFFLWHGIYWAKMPTLARKLQVAFDWAVNYLFPPDLVEIGMLTTRQVVQVDEAVLQRVVEQRPEIRQLAVGDLMSRPAVTLEPGCDLGEAIRRCRRWRTHALPVVDRAGAMVGICTRSDLYRAVRALRPLDTPVEEIMTRPVVSIREDANLSEAVRLSNEHRVKRLVVVSAGAPSHPLGMLTPFDALSWLSGRDRASDGDRW